MGKCAFAAMLLLLAECANSVFEVESASGHNSALSPMLLGAKNPCGVGLRAASLEDPFEAAYVRAVAISPSVGNVTSDLSNVSLVWSWAASFPTSAAFPLPSDGNCPSGHFEIRNPGAARLADGKISYGYKGAAKSIPLGRQGGNPFPLELPKGALFESGSLELFAPLDVVLEGRIEVDYDFRKKEYHESCGMMGDYSVCGCEPEFESGRKTYFKDARHERTFLVENGDSCDFWLNPPLQKRLSGGQGASALLLLRRMPSKISAIENGREIASVFPYSFSLEKGECGEEIAMAVFVPHDKGGVRLNASGSPERMPQLALENEEYLPFHFGFLWNATPGRKNLTIAFEDSFGHETNFTREFSVREPEGWKAGGIGSENEGAATLFEHGNDFAPPSSYPAQEREAPGLNTGALAFLLGVPLLIGASVLLRLISNRLG